MISTNSNRPAENNHPLLPLGCIIMASGHSQRFGSNKLLVDFNGKPLIEYILQATDELFDKRVVVTRYEKIAQLCEAKGIAYIWHDLPYLNDTIRLGLNYLRQYQLEGYLFATSDQPLLQRASIEKLCQSFLDDTYSIQRLAYHTTPGNPMIFPWSLASELRQLPQDKGGGVIAKKYPELVRLVQVRDKFELFDIDTVQDLKRCAKHHLPD